MFITYNLFTFRANQLVDIRKCTTSFFTEVVSILCFGQQNPPHQDLIMELIKIVFDEQLQSTKDFGFSERDKADKIPVVRSFLLRLLVNYK